MSPDTLIIATINGTTPIALYGNMNEMNNLFSEATKAFYDKQKRIKELFTKRGEEYLEEAVQKVEFSFPIITESLKNKL
jgi:hypothetical protein